jgi:glycosyltransferase involved in cell wall biosynthesis
MTPDPDQTLVLYSKLAFYPVHWLALEQIVSRYRVRAVVLAAPEPRLPSVHEAHGVADTAAVGGRPIDVHPMPAGSRRERAVWLARQLRELRPDVVWVQEEPIDPFLLEILALHRFRRRPQIVASVCENIFPPPANPAERIARRLLWPRLNGLIAVAGPSIEGIRAAGMPESVPAASLVAGGLGPPTHVEPRALPFAESDFVVGFSGRIVEEKGWRILVQALGALPPEFKLAVAGDGPDLDELRTVVPGRVHVAGLLPKGELWGFYATIDCLAVPSLTRPRWKEQLGGTLLDGLAMGVPVVASASGGLPDAMGEAGVLVPEGDAAALADALRRLRDDPGLRERLAEAGRERFRREFAIPAYADKIAASLRLRSREVSEASAGR